MFKYKDEVYINKWFYEWQTWFVKHKIWDKYEINIWYFNNEDIIMINKDEIVLYKDSEKYKRIQDSIREEKERYDKLPLWKKIFSDYYDDYDDFTL